MVSQSEINRIAGELGVSTLDVETTFKAAILCLKFKKEIKELLEEKKIDKSSDNNTLGIHVKETIKARDTVR